MRTIKLLQRTLLQQRNLVEIRDAVELVRHRDDGVTRKLLTNDLLDEFVGHVVNAGILVSNVIGGKEKKAYLLVASSSIKIELFRRRAWARHSSCFCP